MCAIKTPFQACVKIKAKGGAPGVDYLSIEEFERHLAKNLSEIQKSLLEQTYTPEPTRRVYIPKDDGEKRKISIPAIKDKIVQEAVRITIEPLFEARFLSSSFAYRANKGPHKAILKLEELLKEGKHWVAQADIDNFFDSINHSLLLQFVQERIWEEPVLRLIKLWLKMGIIDKNEWIEIKEGVPQGGIISPLLSNIYLHSFDLEMLRRKYHLVRYADDFIFAEETKSVAEEALNYADSFLHHHLSLNIAKTEVRHLQNGFVFLGFLFHQNKKTIAPEKIQKMKEKICEIVRGEKDFGQMIFQLNHTIRGWRNYYGISECEEPFHFLEGVIFQEIRNKIKNTPDLNRSVVKERLLSLDLLIPKTPSMKDKFLNLLLYKSKEEPLMKKDKELPSVKKAIAAKRKRYEHLLAVESNLVVTHPNSFLGKSSKRVVLREQRRKVKEIPIYRLKNILITSNGVAISSDLIKFCCQNEVSITFFNEFGYPYGYLFTSRLPFHRLTILQTEAINGEKGLLLAKTFVRGKIRNQINLLKYYNKYRKRKESSFRIEIEQALNKMNLLLQKLEELSTDELLINRLFAIEGQAASIYWSLIKTLLANDVFFEGRERKGARDLVNSLLNYGYGVLYSQVYKAIILAGLNPNIGFLHRGNTERPALLYDLVEEFRQPVVDRAVIGLIRKKVKLNIQGIYLTDDTKLRLVNTIMKELNSRVYYRNRRVKLVEVIHEQAERLAKFLKGLEDYQPFVFY
ncbi:MAG: group II intron reverse transcriptase/maturase [Candidatus Jordarchaeaceae archaeon]